MTTLIDRARHRRSLPQLLVAELARRDGRWGAVSRIAIGCSITVAIAMVFRIPQPTYMAYIVFAVSKDENSSTVTAGAGALVAVTLGIAVTLCLSLIDTAEPALRLPLMALATFLGMFTARTFALGPISYLAGFVIVLLQSVVDDVPNPEALIRATLWIWVVVVVPVVVTVIVNILFGQSVAVFIERTVRKVLQEIQETLGSADLRSHLPVWRARVAPLVETAQHGPRQSGLMVSALLDALDSLEALPGKLPAEVTAELARHVRCCLLRIGNPGAANGPPASDPTALDPAAAAFGQALAKSATSEPLADINTVRTISGSPKRLFVPDAFTNPAHWQFAFKTTIAVMATYAAYTLLDWPGLRTCIVTCFFVALSSLGETIHKLLLRLSGAAIGGLVSGLCIVFVLPYLTDVGQLCILIGGVSLGAAWVATSSELLAYAGMQIAFAFFLGVLQGYAPANDLTVLRDRLVGILLGNVAITLVFSSVWPESARSGLKAALAEALRGIAEVLRQPRESKARTRTAQALDRADHFSALSAFELQMLATPSAEDGAPPLEAVARLAGFAFAATYASEETGSATGVLGAYARWAESAADGPARSAPAPAPLDAPYGPVFRRALEQLDAEVRHVSAQR